MAPFQGDAVRYMSVDFGFWAAWSTDSYGQSGDGNGFLTVPSAFWSLAGLVLDFPQAVPDELEQVGGTREGEAG